MGLSDDEFGALTPYQFEALLERLNLSHRRHELHTGNLAATVANTGFRAPENPATPADFMPSELALAKSEATPEPKRMTAEEFSQAMRGVAKRVEARLGVLAVAQEAVASGQ